MTEVHRHDVTTPLLTRIASASLDQDYRLAADRDRGTSKGTAGRSPSVLLVIAVLGLLVGTAAAKAAQSADDAQGQRSSLIKQIAGGRERVNIQRQTLTDLRAKNRTLEGDIGTVGQGLASVNNTIDRLAQVTGFAAVSGPGVRIVVDDAANADELGLVRADDLGILVDGLWNAGAEAISIDDQRVTPLTALRNSGLSIGVNRVPLRAPYTVRAIGNPDTMEAKLLESTSGLAWEVLVAQLGFRVDIDTVDDMTLPAARSRPLEAARVASVTAGSGDTQEIGP
ncbi:MAG: DUF881 domain-containing protein [Nocardioides sp.]